MASWERMVHDSQQRIFIPINVDLSYENDSFLTLPKGLAIFGSVGAYVLTIAWGANTGLTVFGWIVILLLLTLVVQYIIRKVVFQENYFFKQWTITKKLGKPKASRFWNIASIRKTLIGDILVFSDMKLGAILELDKDTIIGKASDNEEEHYDAWSEFYRTVFDMRLSIAQMNLMEPAGRDKRFNELSDIAQSSSNPRIRTLLEQNVGYMKYLSGNTLDEHDYILVYTKDMNRMDTLLNDILEAGSCLMDGAYVGARILSESEIYNLPRGNFNVKFFDGVEAQMNVYRTGGYTIKSPFHITGLEFEGHKKVTITPELEKKLEQASKLVDNENISFIDWNVLDALNGKWSQQYTHTTGKQITLDGEEIQIDITPNIQATEEERSKTQITKSRLLHSKTRQRAIVKDRSKAAPTEELEDTEIEKQKALQRKQADEQVKEKQTQSVAKPKKKLGIKRKKKEETEEENSRPDFSEDLTDESLLEEEIDDDTILF